MGQHATDSALLQDATALVHPFVALELICPAFTQLKVWAQLGPILEGLGNGARVNSALVITPWLYLIPIQWINLPSYALGMALSTFAALSGGSRLKCWG